jgi:hypothetical protein
MTYYNQITDVEDEAAYRARLAAQAEAEAVSEYDGARLIKAVLLCLKDNNPQMTLPTRAAVIAKYKGLA